MNKNELEQKQQSILESLESSFQKQEVFAAILPKEETAAVNMLVVQHTGFGEDAEEAMGEYYFLPAREEDAWFHYFVESITLSEDLPEDKQGVLGAAVSMINFTLPVGAFCLSPDGKVIFYRYTLMLEADRDTEHTEAMIRSSMLNVLQYAVRWADALDALEYGRMTLEEFTETFAEVISSASL